MFPTAEDGKRALAAISKGPALVEKIIRENNIDADIRPGYVYIADGKQQLLSDKDYFGIEPYPFILGMAEAARKLGVKIYEDTPVGEISEKDGLEVRTSRGSIFATDILAAGGHKMAETVPYLKSLRHRTLELQATTIVTDPLPPEVIKSIMPQAGGAHYGRSRPTRWMSPMALSTGRAALFSGRMSARCAPTPPPSRKNFSAFSRH